MKKTKPSLWDNLPKADKEKYKKLLLGFASMSDLYAQKKTDEEIVAPVINSKFQETIFQKTFNATQEDISNTPFDVSLTIINNGNKDNYVVGIKTFNYGNSSEKIAQFKQISQELTADVTNIVSDPTKTKKELDKINNPYYENIAKTISELRNDRIDSALANLAGFKLNSGNIISVYHVIMTSSKNKKPQLYVGETPYTKINIEKLKILGCTRKNTPQNFQFADDTYTYIYHPADSQLLMKFNGEKIKRETWNVKYLKDPMKIMMDIYNLAYVATPPVPIKESHSWLLTNKNDKVELFSGFNGFYGVGSKLSKSERTKKITQLKTKYRSIIANQTEFDILINNVTSFLTNTAKNNEERMKKVALRDQIMKSARSLDSNHNLEKDLEKLLYRPANEMYIPIPNSKKFHQSFPDFFAPSAGELKNGKAVHPKEARAFTLTLEPSGESLRAFLVQDNLKGIESEKEQGKLGNWILRGIFQLKPYQPLTAKRLREIGKNGIRLYKRSDKNDVILEFIEIDPNELPEDYWN